ncbi:MAG: response regulator [Candidatus Delongbacteria bacterium]|nr:response regulator [Candidatus Delongbacteria bacterium]
MEKMKILVIDDEEGIRESVKRALRNFTVSLSYIEDDYSFEIDSAETAEEGFEMIKQGNYGVLLLDNQLPGMNGTELLKLLHDSQINIITIMITAFASIETAITATKNGAYDFVTKPFTPQELKDSVFKAVKHQILSSITKRLVEEKKKIRFQFISVLSHELKSPIAAVSNYLKLMEKKIAGDNINAYSEFISRSQIRIKDMEKLIFDLLDLTRIESGEKKRELAYVRFDEIVKETLDNFSEDLKKKRLELETELDETVITADATELAIITNNLISNAIKYNREEGKVTVNLKNRPDETVFSVGDTGIGIAEKDTDKLFKEFSRIKTEETVNISGSGIGLSTVKKIVSLYGGSTHVRSTQGEGSVFTVVLKKKEID